MKFFVILPCAGQGKRFGQKKQFVKLFGKEIFLYPLEEILRIGIVDKIILTFPKENLEKAKQIICNFFKDISKFEIIPGGKERQESVFLALRYIKENFKCDIVSIHDCVRPLVKKEDFVRSYESLITKNVDGVILGVPPKDTIKVKDNHLVKETLDRNKLILAQTPQTFYFEIIYQGHLWARKNNIFVTDDASILEQLGKKIYILKGDYKNIKVTTAEDLIIAKELFKCYFPQRIKKL